MANSSCKSIQTETTQQLPVLSLPAFEGLAFDFVVCNQSAACVLWVNDCFVYNFHGQASLSFVFARSGRIDRNSARLIDRLTSTNAQETDMQLFQTLMRITINGMSHILTVALCESKLMDAPAILSRDDYSRFITQ